MIEIAKDSINYEVTKVKKGEAETVCRIASDSLLLPRAKHHHVMDFFKLNGLKNVRAIRDGSKIIGGLQIIHWAHWFGGRSVPAAGIAFVGILPEHRGKGAATHLMNETVRELHADGIAISTLHPENIPLYRRAGYEQAIEHANVKIDIRKISTRNLSCNMVQLKGKSTRTLETVYDQFASATNGNVNRTEMIWKKVLAPISPYEVVPYLIKNGSQVEGYAVVRLEGKHRMVVIDDFCFLTRDATERFLTYLKDHSSMNHFALYHGSSDDPMLSLLPEGGWEVTERNLFMLRILSVPNALKARGYALGVEGELHLDVTDDVISENAGRYVLTVKNGKGKVKDGGKGRVRLDVRSLAQLYSSHKAPSELKTTSMIQGPASDLSLMGAIFSGPRPWMRDDY